MGDGSGPAPMESSRPKSARMSVCQRSTAASAAARKKVTDMAKNGTGFQLGGALNTDKTIQGSAPKRGAKARTAAESANDAAMIASGTAASAGRAQAKDKATVCESDGVLFDKNKRCSFMPESRKMATDASARGLSSKEGEMGRKTFSSRDHTSTVFSSTAAPEHRPTRVVNIKQEAPSLPASNKNEATQQAYNAMNAASDAGAEGRANNRKHQTSSSIFSSNTENVGCNISRPTTASYNKNASSVFGGGAFADDAAKSRPTSAARPAPALNVSGPAFAAGGGGGMASARASAQAALRGNGGLW